jgi:hypothetical protein
VIIDLCRQHGMWFDTHELAAVLDWIARGGRIARMPQEQAPLPQAKQRDTKAEQQRIRQLQAEFEARERLRRNQQDPLDQLIGDVAESVLGSLSKFFDL